MLPQSTKNFNDLEQHFKIIIKYEAIIVARYDDSYILTVIPLLSNRIILTPCYIYGLKFISYYISYTAIYTQFLVHRLCYIRRKLRTFEFGRYTLLNKPLYKISRKSSRCVPRCCEWAQRQTNTKTWRSVNALFANVF